MISPWLASVKRQRFFRHLHFSTERSFKAIFVFSKIYPRNRVQSYKNSPGLFTVRSTSLPNLPRHVDKIRQDSHLRFWTHKLKIRLKIKMKKIKRKLLQTRFSKQKKERGKKQIKNPSYRIFNFLLIAITSLSYSLVWSTINPKSTARRLPLQIGFTFYNPGSFNDRRRVGKIRIRKPK